MSHRPVTDHANALLMLADILNERDLGEHAAAARREAIAKLRAKGTWLREPRGLLRAGARDKLEHVRQRTPPV